jgi:hypothetical protein
MPIVRYVVLAALVVWLGALQGSLLGPEPPRYAAIELACGGIVLLGLLAMKFLGPPPRGFSIRLPIVIVMLAVAAYDRMSHPHRVSTIVTTALGFTLLFWYARE